MENQGYPQLLRKAIQSLYIDTKIITDVFGKLTRDIPTNEGVRQGCCIS